MISNHCCAHNLIRLNVRNVVHINNVRNFSSSTVLAKKVTNPDGVNLGSKIRVAKNSYRMGGKIGIETLVQEEKRILAELVAHESKGT